MRSNYLGGARGAAGPQSPRAPLLLSSAGRPALTAMAADNVLLAFDFDGTLAPIVADPAQAALRARTRTLLRAVGRRYPVAVLSGRQQADVSRRLEGTGVWVCTGYTAYWIDGSQPAVDLRRLVVAWRVCLGRWLGDRRDVVIEDKDFALALHYRQTADPEAALQAITEALGSLARARITLGHCVVNVEPAGTMSKAAVLARICHDFGCRAALYVGDDTEDEGVFHLADRMPMLAVRVGESARTAAAYRLKSQREIDGLLELLSRLRA